MHPQDVPFGREYASFAGSPRNDETDPVVFQPGFVKRAAAFTEHLKRAEAYVHDPRVTKLALIRDLALGCPELSDTAFRQVVALILLVPPAGWERGALLVHIGNRLLGSLLGSSETALRRAGRELEEAGLVLRHMDEANHPASGRRFDLRPLAARHAEISARITETFAAHQRARAARRFCRTDAEAAPESTSDSTARPEAPPAGSAPETTAPEGRPNPAGGAAKSGAPSYTGTEEDGHGKLVQRQQAEAVDKSAKTSQPSRPQRSSFRSGASKPKEPRRGYWRPTDPTPPPRTLTSAVTLLSRISVDFATALKNSARDPAAPSIDELLEAADRLREFLSVPRSVWVESHGRLDRLERVAIVVAAMSKPQSDFRTSRTAWARSMLSRHRGEIDIWATIKKLQVSRARLN